MAPDKKERPRHPPGLGTGSAGFDGAEHPRRGARGLREKQRFDLHAWWSFKHHAEEIEMETRPTYVYVTYIHSTAERVWAALTDTDVSARFWGHSDVSDWQPGSRWEHRRTDGSGIADIVGTVLEADPPEVLPRAPWEMHAEQRAVQMARSGN